MMKFKNGLKKTEQDFKLIFKTNHSATKKHKSLKDINNIKTIVVKESHYPSILFDKLLLFYVCALSGLT